MKRRIAILFAFIFLITTTELGQLLKFPILIEHFVEHKAENPNLSLWNYLQIHYSQQYKEEGDPTDEKLPFANYTNVIHILATTPPTILKIEKIKISTAFTKIHALDDFFVDSAFLSSIWQPPKKY